jgi:hypothetical protein
VHGGIGGLKAAAVLTTPQELKKMKQSSLIARPAGKHNLKKIFPF